MEKISWSSEKRKISELNAAPYNPRQLTEKQAHDLTNSLDKFSLAEPIVINLNNTVIGGHQRINILRTQGSTEVDVRVPDRLLTDEEERELNLRLNKNQGMWDFDALANMDEEMLLHVGFGPAELDDIFQLNEQEVDKDETPDAPETPIAKIGDIFQLGDHRVMCGDSTRKDHIEALLRNNDGVLRADLLFTDPPYNVNYSGTGENTSKGIENDNLSKEAFDDFTLKVFENAYEAMREGGVYYICSGWSSYPTFNESLLKNGFYRSGVIIWAKNNASMGFNDYRYKHEWILVGKRKEHRVRAVSILYGWKKGPHFFRDTRDEYDVWECPREASANYKHPTQKPVWLIEKALANSSERGQIVLDLFGGSGSTLIACDRLKRRAFLMEYDPKYVDVIIQRWETYTKQKAVKVS